MRDGTRSWRSHRVVARGLVGAVLAAGGMVGMASAATIHAAPAGNDGHPFRSLSRAVELAENGDRAGGTFDLESAAR